MTCGIGFARMAWALAKLRCPTFVSHPFARKYCPTHPTTREYYRILDHAYHWRDLLGGYVVRL